MKFRVQADGFTSHQKEDMKEPSIAIVTVILLGLRAYRNVCLIDKLSNGACDVLLCQVTAIFTQTENSPSKLGTRPAKLSLTLPVQIQSGGLVS